MSTASHFKTSRELRSLYAVLEEWVKLNRNIGRQWSKEVGDLPWRYNERALLSLFAGAVWRIGGHAFEEFSEVKHSGRRKRKGNGRVDLWFETSGREFRAEAKHDEVPITNKAQQLASLHALMARAVKDARRNLFRLSQAFLAGSELNVSDHSVILRPAPHEKLRKVVTIPCLRALGSRGNAVRDLPPPVDSLAEVGHLPDHVRT